MEKWEMHTNILWWNLKVQKQIGKLYVGAIYYQNAWIKEKGICLDSKQSYFKCKMCLNIFQDTGEIITLKLRSKQLVYSTANA